MVIPITLTGHFVVTVRAAVIFFCLIYKGESRETDVLMFLEVF